MSCVMLLAYHDIQISSYTVGFDDPVDRLGALEQQDNITKHQGIVLQRS